MISALAIDPAAVPGAIANRMLEHEAWARQRLGAHADRMFAVAVGPLSTAFAVDPTGRVASSLLSGRAPDLTLRISPLDVPALLADPARWDRYVTSEGDAALAATLKELAPTMPWLVEQTFARVLGSIAGRHVAEVGRRVLAFPEHAAQRIGDSVVGYAHEQSGLLATGDEGSAFAKQVGALSTRVDALSARLDLLAGRVSEVVAPAPLGKRKARPPQIV